MRFIRPVNVTSAMLISSNVPEDDYPEWAAGTLTKGTRRIVAAQHHVYEVLADSTTDSPLVGLAKEVPTWMDLGATNRWKMLDDKVGTQTTRAGSVSVTIKPGSVFNGLALINVTGESVDITVTDPVDGVVYSQHISLIYADVDNWYDWFFEDIDFQTSMVRLDLPAYGTANVTVTVNSSGTAGVGALILGRINEIGVALYGTGVGIDDYSRKERDTFGNLVVTERAYSDNADFPIKLATSRVAKVKRMMAEVRAKPVVWIGEETYEATILYGFYKSFSEIYSGPTDSDMQLTIEGLT